MKYSAIKKLIAVMLSSLFLLGLVLPAGADATVPLVFTADGKNASRAADTIIIYTLDGTTGTNRFGYEISVDKTGKIISVGGNNSVVPEDGFVLSGHGEGGKFLKENVQTGYYASFCPLTLEVTVDTVRHLPFGSKTVALSAVNAHRSSNFLVVYTPEFKYETTNTNRWGNEAVVENGIITSVGGNNNKIPENGFVISAVENALAWFSDAISIGNSAYVSLADKTLTVSYDMQSAIFADRDKLNKLHIMLNEAADIQAANSAYAAAESQLNGAISKYESDGNAFDYLDFSKSFAHTVDSAAALAYESCTEEVRAVWYSPRETNRDEVEKIVEQMYELGLNTISVCGFSDGVFQTSLPQDSPFTSALSLGKEDIIKYFVEACHKRNMKFSLWMPVYFAGYTGSTYLVTKAMPDLQVLSQNNKPETNDGFVFLDPSNPNVTSLLLNTYEHILKNYDIDVFELDYIRYAAASNGIDFGYHTTAQSEFIEQYGETPVFDRSWSLWEEWCLFRCSYITGFVGDMHNLIKNVKPNTLLSADVFGGNDNEYSIYQDWETWTEKGYIDILIPMLYGANTFYDGIDIFSEHVKNGNYMLVTGLSVSGDAMTPEILAGQIKTARDKGAGGVSFFSLPNVFKCSNPRIKDGLFKERAEYPISFYTVSFTDFNGNLINTQTVKGGCGAQAPTLTSSPTPHAVFERWNADFTSVCSDITVSPEYSYTECVDENNDFMCDICTKSLGAPDEADPPENDCSCICHKTGFLKIIWKIQQFFYKIFGINPVCKCTAAHY